MVQMAKVTKSTRAILLGKARRYSCSSQPYTPIPPSRPPPSLPAPKRTKGSIGPAAEIWRSVAAGFLGDGVHHSTSSAGSHQHQSMQVPKRRLFLASILFASLTTGAPERPGPGFSYSCLFLVPCFTHLFAHFLCSLTGVCAGVRPSKYGAMSRSGLSLASRDGDAPSSLDLGVR